MQYEEIEKLVRLFEESSLMTMELEEGNLRIFLSKAEGYTKQEPETVPEDTSSEICSELIGTFYAAPAENAEPFVKTGDTVTKGQTLCIIEAMKIMHEVTAPYDCVIEDILVRNEETVEYGQSLFSARKTGDPS